MTDEPPTDTDIKTREFAENAHSLSATDGDDSDYAPQHQKDYKPENVDADATASSFFDGASNNSENGNARRFAGRTLNTEWNRDQGPIRELNGLRLIDGKLVESEDEADDDLEEAVDREERQRERRLELERQQWSSTRHEYFGANLTGEEWGQLASEIGKGGALRQGLVDRLMSQGKTREEAERKANEMSELLRILEKPEGQRTAAEKAKVEAAKTDPDYNKNIPWMAEQRQGRSYGAVNRVEQSTSAGAQRASIEVAADVLDAPLPAALTSREIVAVTRTTSVAAETDLQDTPFATAPDLQENYLAALAATEPLDAPAAPTRVAAITPPTPPPGGGFEV